MLLSCWLLLHTTNYPITVCCSATGCCRRDVLLLSVARPLATASILPKGPCGCMLGLFQPLAVAGVFDPEALAAACWACFPCCFRLAVAGALAPEAPAGAWASSTCCSAAGFAGACSLYHLLMLG